MASNSQMSLLLILTCILALTSSISATPTIYEVFNQYGFPPGILPDSVESYSLTGDTFVVYLKKPCYVQYDYLIHFDTEISGKISYGKMTGLKGVSAQSFWFWFNVDEIKVDGHSLQFTIGIISSKSDIAQFEKIPVCKDKALVAYDGPSSKLISQV
ncbi:hypothetical protein QVD17_11281 [Tagetes erecta]|uniref:Uncharacterized protein n=1 Tax=Tagetes erecta TaxID=13708 RepID=A0AAD8KXV0_TARER|nr:hypothetical protein QVD17_11281 [Tagetes erecta]